MVDKAPPEPLAIADGVMFNAYPDSIGERFADTVSLLRQPELEDVLSLFYVLPTFFNSDLDRGFSIIDYGLNADLVDPSDARGERTTRRTWRHCPSWA